MNLLKIVRELMPIIVLNDRLVLDDTPDGWDYRRVCVDGPAFDAAGLKWS